MSENILDTSKSYFTKELIAKAALYLGESQTGISKAIEGILPALCTGLAHKSLTTAGTTQLLATAREQHRLGILENIGDYFENDGGGILNKGAKQFSALFGENTDSIIALISNFGGITKASASTLLSVASPAIIGILGNEVVNNHLDHNGLAGLLRNQKNIFVSALPPGLNFAKDMETKSTHYSNEIKSVMDNSADNSSNGLKILLPLLLLALTAGAFLYFWNGATDTKKKEPVANNELPSISGNSENGSPAINGFAGTVDTNGNFVYDEGDTVTITLPDNAGVLKVGKYSTEAKLYTFLQDGNSSIDSIKGNWFEFTHVRFKTGGAGIEDVSMQQLKNMVSITKGFTKAQFKIGGYTDSTGNTDTNITLSQDRADAVLAMLIKLGASAKSITGAKGYGPEHPVASNNTPEGRAQNRRVAVNVKAK